MQLILREDVYNLGNSGDVVTVKNGYGRNYLLPRKLAVLASAKNLRQLEHERQVIEARQAKLKGTAETLSKVLANLHVKILRKVGEQDKLYGSVTALDIAEALLAQGQKLDRRVIHLPDPIRSVGTFEVEVRLHRDVPCKIKVEVAPQA